MYRIGELGYTKVALLARTLCCASHARIWGCSQGAQGRGAFDN